MIDAIIRDVRYNVRSLSKTPIFALTVVLLLALGIGANTAVFSIVDRLLLRPLPYPAGEKLMMLHEVSRSGGRMDVSPANWLDWQRDSRSFEGFAAWTNRIPLTLTGEGEPERLETDSVSHEFFPLLGVRPLLGRVFSAEDDRPNPTRKVILSYSLWQRKFGGDENVVGRIVQLNAGPSEIVGVMPAGFHFLSNETDIWQALGLDRNLAWRERAGRFIPFVVGRLKSSVTPEAAAGEITGIMGRLSQLHAFNKDTSVKAIPLREVITGEVRTSLLVLFAAVGLLLLIGCSDKSAVCLESSP